MTNKSRSYMRNMRHARIRKKISGTAERPRLCVYRSLNHIYAQLIDDTKGHTLCASSSTEKEISGAGNIEGAKKVGHSIAVRALEKGVKKIVFDRGGFRYQGSIAGLADAAREAGLEF